MRTIIITLIISICAGFNPVNAKKIQLPLKGNTVQYSGSINVNNVASSDYLCQKVKSWIIQTRGNSKFNISTEKTECCEIDVEISNVLEPNGLFNDVECYYKVHFSVKDGVIDYQITDLSFKKAYQTYSVADIYKSYLQGNPYVKDKRETKRSALKRHAYLLKLLDNNLNNLLGSFNTCMNTASATSSLACL